MPWVVDGISLPLVVLTAFVTVPVVIAGWTVIQTRPAQYFAAFLIMEGLMIGVFSSLDALLFYFFWEAMLIPMFLIIGIWGGRGASTPRSNSFCTRFWARCSCWWRSSTCT
jgi:NADH-quinone oxidoreductase subunit M